MSQAPFVPGCRTNTLNRSLFSGAPGTIYCPALGYTGIMRPDRKLTEDQVRHARVSLKSAVQLAGDFEVDRKVIDRVRLWKTYKEVLDVPPSAAAPAALPDNDYVVGDSLELMGKLPAGYAQTIVAAPPVFRPPHASQSQVRKARSGHVDRQKSIIREGLRIAGPNGVLLYVHRYDLMADLLEVGPGGISEFSPEQVIIWDTMTKEDPPSASTRRVPGTHRAIYVFAGNRWRIPPEIRDEVRRLGDVWHFKANLPDAGSLEFPEQLTDLLISMGPGRVLDPFAGVGIIGLAAARKNRDWILFGKSAVDQRTFRQSLQDFYSERGERAMTPTVQSVRPRPQSRSTGRRPSRSVSDLPEQQRMF